MTSIDAPRRALDRRFILFLAGFYTAWCLRVVLLLPIDQQIENEWFRQGWSQGLRIALWVLPMALYLRCVDRTGVLSFLKADTLPRGRRLLRGLGIMVVFLTAITLSALAFQGGSLTKLFSMKGPQWAVLLIGMSVVSVAEEALFRGFILQKLQSAFSFHWANLLTAVLFLLIHWPGWLYMQGLHSGLLPLCAGVFIAGWVFGLTFQVTRSLWPPVVLHLLNNVWSVLLLA